MPTNLTELENKSRLLSSRMADYFCIHAEQRGRPLFTKAIKRLYADWGARDLKQRFTIDFLLVPKPSAIDAGWELGCIGIEAKPSKLEGSSFGRALAQIMDYQVSVFRPPGEDCGEKELSMVFLLGPDRFHGTEASLLMQEGIGVVRISGIRGEVKLLHGNGMHPIATLTESALVYRRPRFGLGTGHR